MFASRLRVLVLLASFTLAGCLLPLTAPDPAAAELARGIDNNARQFYAQLAAAPAPQCAYAANENFYDRLHREAAALRDHLAQRGASPAAQRAGEAMLRLSNDVRASHQTASARLDDQHGPCMAPQAIALNADALARAAAAIFSANSQGAE